MKRVLTFLLLLICYASFGQTKSNTSNKIEFYLLKENKQNLDTTIGLRNKFKISITDLADTAFIKDYEILGYTFKKEPVKLIDSIFIQTRQMFEVTAAVTQRINNLKIPLCCGKQFALVVNGNIVYAGYFWNLFSSHGCDGITAFALDNKIDILKKLPDIDFAVNAEDLRQNAVLFDCLTKTNRLHK